MAGLRQRTGESSAGHPAGRFREPKPRSLPHAGGEIHTEIGRRCIHQRRLRSFSEADAEWVAPNEQPALVHLQWKTPATFCARASGGHQRPRRNSATAAESGSAITGGIPALDLTRSNTLATTSIADSASKVRASPTQAARGRTQGCCCGLTLNATNSPPRWRTQAARRARRAGPAGGTAFAARGDGTDTAVDERHIGRRRAQKSVRPPNDAPCSRRSKLD